MDQSQKQKTFVDKTMIIKGFRQNGINLNTSCLNIVIDFLSPKINQQMALKTLISKINQISIKTNEAFGENMVRTAAQILSLGDKIKFSSYDDIVEAIRKLTIMYISPYENNESNFFNEKPNSEMFKVDPQEIMVNDLKRFKAIEKVTKQTLKSSDWTIGMLYEDFTKTSHYNEMTKSRLILQNQATQIEIVFQQNFEHKYPLISGCIYAVRGRQMSKNRVLTVEELVLPTPLSEQKQRLTKKKLKYICDKIHIQKNSVVFEAKDFIKYETIFNEREYNSLEEEDKKDKKERRKERKKETRNIFIFGGVRINKNTVERIYRLLTMSGIDPDAPTNLECIVLMLDKGEHEEIDLKVWFKKIVIFIVPHFGSEGPSLLPKIPILNKSFNEFKVLTNPARFSIYGREVQFLNIPLMDMVNAKNILKIKNDQRSDEEEKKRMAKSISELLFSQSTTQFCSLNYPKQSEYFSLREETLLFLSDNSCDQMECQEGKTKKRKMVSVGNFSRDGQFVVFDPDQDSEFPIGLCRESEC